jgi:GxxExxY protein
MDGIQMTSLVVQGAIAVHRELGPGLLESTYQKCLAFELAERGLSVEREVALPVVYKGNRIDCGYRIDLLVENSVIVEIKCVSQLDPIFMAQMLTYLKLTNLGVGLLMNFNVRRMVDGIRRVAHGFELPLPASEPAGSRRRGVAGPLEPVLPLKDKKR